MFKLKTLTSPRQDHPVPIHYAVVSNIHPFPAPLSTGNPPIDKHHTPIIIDPQPPAINRRLHTHSPVLPLRRRRVALDIKPHVVRPKPVVLRHPSVVRGPQPHLERAGTTGREPHPAIVGAGGGLGRRDGPVPWSGVVLVDGSAVGHERGCGAGAVLGVGFAAVIIVGARGRMVNGTFGEGGDWCGGRGGEGGREGEGRGECEEEGFERRHFGVGNSGGVEVDESRLSVVKLLCQCQG